MIKSILTLVVLSICLSSNAQNMDLKPCGTAPLRSQWLIKHQLHPQNWSGTRDDILYVPIAVSVIGEDNGSKFIPNVKLQTALCQLNNDFMDAEIQFYLGTDIRYIADSRYAIHETVLQGAQMMAEYDLPDMINCYFMEDAASNCGYNLPYAGMCISNNCAGPTDHTWAHEMGHQLSLPHPFLGWEGGVSYDGSVSHDFDDPAPEFVLFDYTYFKDTLILDTLIIDTSYVEKMDGSNCTMAADGFCDTAPDYLSSRWGCNEDNMSPTEQTDPDGVKFISDGTLIMSYALDNCSSRFTPDQITAMRANLMEERTALLGHEELPPVVTATELVDPYPTDLEPVFPENIELGWVPVENATHYLVELTLNENFGFKVFDTIVNTNSVMIPKLQFATREHYFHVKTFSEYNFCSDWLEGSGSFTPDNSVATDNEANTTWNIYPTLIKRQRYLHIDADAAATNKTEIVIYNTNGQIVLNSTIHHSESVDIRDLRTGVYIVKLGNGHQQYTQRIIVQ